MYLSRNATDRQRVLQTRSSSGKTLVTVTCLPVKTSADRRDVGQELIIFSQLYCAGWPCNAFYTRTTTSSSSSSSCGLNGRCCFHAVYTRTVSLKSTRCQTGNSAAAGELVWYAAVFQFSWSDGQLYGIPHRLEFLQQVTGNSTQQAVTVV